MFHRSLFISITVSILLFASSAHSQQPASLRGSDEPATAALRKKAVDLLELVAGQVSSLHSAENRARIGSNVAALLWEYDEKRSRVLFGAVAEDIKAGFNDTDPDYSAHIHTVMVFRQLRIDTLDRIAKHDAELALEFLRATEPASDLQLPFQMRAGEKNLELRLASQVAATNPQLTLKLGRRSLGRGFSPELLPLLSQLRWKDTEALRSFYKTIVDKLKSANLQQDSAATEIALYLAHAFRPPEVDEQVYRDLLGVLLTSAFARGCAEATTDNPPHHFCFQMGSLFSRIEMYYGSRAAPFRRFAEDVETPVVSAAEMWEPI